MLYCNGMLKIGFLYQNKTISKANMRNEQNILIIIASRYYICVKKGFDYLKFASKFNLVTWYQYILNSM